MGRRGGRMNRKRKKHQAQRDSKNKQDSTTTTTANNNNNRIDDRDTPRGYTPITQYNARLDAYLCVVQSDTFGMRYDEAQRKFVKCATEKEKWEERQRFFDTMRSILPSSFRIGRDVDEVLRNSLVKEIEEFVSKEMEITVPVATASTTTTAITTNSNNNADSDSQKGETKQKIAADDKTKKFNEEEKKKKVMEDEKEKDEEDEDGQPPHKILKHNDTDATANTNTETNTETNTKTATIATTTTTIAPAKRIPFVANAYQLNLDRRTIRRNPCLAELHDWLKIQTSAGFLTRQETVSMIPPVVLDPQPHHTILDMCAAPGSKTSQLLEVVSTLEGTETTGCVVANDNDAKRAYMLVHQLRRLNTPNVLVTACDAQRFPTLKQQEREQQQDGESESEGTFDRVLCDVPCSGDGTIRKNPNVWRNWNQHGSLALHALQLDIALRGARLTKVGGYLCYSTCSMNPVENEAVVAELIRSTDGALELVEKRPDLPGLRARPGWTDWTVWREALSKKMERDLFKKKNNAKMQARRQEWAEKIRKQQQEQQQQQEQKEERDKGNNDNNNNNNNNNGGEDSKKSSTLEEQSKEQQSEQQQQQQQREPFDLFTELPPPSNWDIETLKERARSVGLVEFATFDDVPEDQKRRVRVSCFPPTKEEVSQFGLEKCLRCFPQDMNTGGFFVALFKKVKPLHNNKIKNKTNNKNSNNNDNNKTTSKEEEENVVMEDQNDDGDDKVELVSNLGVESEPMDTTTDAVSQDDESEGAIDTDAAMTETEANFSADGDAMIAESIESEKKDKKTAGKDDKDFSVAKTWENKPKHNGTSSENNNKNDNSGNDDFVPADKSVWPPLVELYGLSDDFPKDQCMSRSSPKDGGGGDSKVIYFVSKTIKNLMDQGIQERVTVINSGLKAFERNSKDVDSRYRITQEAIHFTASFMTKRRFVVKLDDYRKCLATGAIPLDGFSAPFAEEVRALSVGAFVVVLEGYLEQLSKKMFLVMWRCRGDSVNCLVAKVEMDGMKSKLRGLEMQMQMQMQMDEEKTKE